MYVLRIRLQQTIALPLFSPVIQARERGTSPIQMDMHPIPGYTVLVNTRLAYSKKLSSGASHLNLRKDDFLRSASIVTVS